MVSRDEDIDIDLVMGDMEGDLDPAILSFQASATIAVCSAVLIGNAFVCALNCFKTGAKQYYLKFILLAAVVNMVSAIICMPLMAVALIEGNWRYGYPLCKVTGLTCFLSMVFTMTLSALAAILKLGIFTRTNFTKLLFRMFLQTDFIITSIVFLFIAVSQFVLFVLIYDSNLFKAPLRVLCKYANSPSLTAYRIFYLVYSTLLTLAAFILVIPYDQERTVPENTKR